MKGLKFKDRKELNEVERYMPGKLMVTSNKKLKLMSSLPYCSDLKEMDPRLNLVKKIGLDKISCSRCETTTQSMNIPTGCLTPTYMVIGECPGQANRGKILPDRVMSFGKVSNYLKRSFWDLGIYDQVWYTNMVKCSVEGNRRITEQEAKKCCGWLKKEIKYLKPKVIIVLGNSAYDMFCKMIVTDAKVVKVKHPAYFIRRNKSWNEYRDYLKEEIGIE
jgi:uracil-DNA glycosylase family 4